ncbi:PucR family transcriptional regulator [Fusibacter bizertensis]
MKLKDLLKRSPFESAKVIVGEKQLHQEVLSAMILEAVDIEIWGEPHQIILTSYFALERLNSDELDAFFKKMSYIGTTGLVLKMDRLIKEVPQQLIDLCMQYEIPLITIPQAVHYETIIFEVLRPVINHNANLLEKYYQTRQNLNKLAPQMPSIEEMLYQFKELLGLDFQFTMPLKNKLISTHDHAYNYRIKSSHQLKQEKFMSYTYTRHQIVSLDQNICPPSMVCVEIPNLENQKYMLSIFEDKGPLSELDYMVIENAVEFLQAELLKNYTIKHSQFLKKNNLMVDLLNTRYYSNVEQEELLSLVGLNQFKYYQGLMISIYDTQNATSAVVDQFLNALVQAIRDQYAHLAFYVKNNRVIFLKNIQNPQHAFQKSDLSQLIDKVSKDYLLGHSSFYCHLAMSSIHDRDGLKEINKECIDTSKMMTHFYQDTRLMHYDNLGIFKYFLETDSLNELEKFIPKDLANLRMESPELFKTLKVFLLENQNYVLTASKLFIHPKTVRYRIDKIKNILDVNFEDAEQILLYQIAIRLYEFL